MNEILDTYTKLQKKISIIVKLVKKHSTSTPNSTICQKTLNIIIIITSSYIPLYIADCNLKAVYIE